MYSVVAIGTVLIIYYAPSATKKQPIPSHLKMKKKLLSIIITMVLLIISFLAPEPFKQLILLELHLRALHYYQSFFLGRIINYDSISRFNH